MEFLQTDVNCLLNYNKAVGDKIKSLVPHSIEREDMLKSVWLVEKVVEKFLAHYKKEDLSSNKLFEGYLNEIYYALRKINLSLFDLETGSVFSKEKHSKAVKECCLRQELFVREIYNSVKGLKVENKKNFENKAKKFTFLLNINFARSIPNSAENMFMNLYQFKEEVYFIKTDDIFSYFYFYRDSKGNWFWSPPRKDDPEDVWMETPDTKVETGYWKGKSIPQQVADFIKWLDLFRPNIPEFYIKKVLKTQAVSKPGTMENLKENAEIIGEHLNNGKCQIF